MNPRMNLPGNNRDRLAVTRAPHRVEWGMRMTGHTRVRGLFAVALALASFAACANVAAADSTAQFTDWTAVGGNVATGTLFGHTVTLSGSHVFNLPISVTDGSWSFWNGPDFTPPLAKSDEIQIGGLPGYSYVLDLGAPTTNPVLDLGSLADRIDFPASTQITKLSGDSNFTVAGNSVTGALVTALGPDGVNDSNGTVMVHGTFQSISFTVNPVYVPGSEDGILVQVGAAAPVSPPPPPPSSAPVVTSLNLVGTSAASRQVLLNASVSGSAQKLLWSVRGRTLIGGAAQSFLRFRPPPGATTVTVRAVSSAGVVGPVRTRTVFGAKLTTGGLAGRIGALVARGPSVFAVGSSSLRGGVSLSKLACAAFPTTVSAGGLQVRGCLLPVQSLGDIPAAERGIIENLASQLHIGTDVPSIDTAISLTDAYHEYRPGPDQRCHDDSAARGGGRDLPAGERDREREREPVRRRAEARRTATVRYRDAPAFRWYQPRDVCAAAWRARQHRRAQIRR